MTTTQKEFQTNEEKYKASNQWRCERISLMHAGQVLVCDEPQHLVDAKGASSLEEAFIGYLEDAIGGTDGRGSCRSSRNPGR